MERIVTAIRLPENVTSSLGAIGAVVGPDDWHAHLPGAAALIATITARVNREVLDRADSLRIVANAAVGYDNIDLAECERRGIVVTNTPDVLTDATADLTIALLLATVRGLSRAERSLRAGEFRSWSFWNYLEGDVGGATLGVYGLGRIGRAVARRALAFNMRIQYHGRHHVSPDEERELGATWVDWDTLVTTSDILTLHAPYSQATHHVVDAAVLQRMKPGSYLINTARGALVDEAALVEALRKGPLAGAGLDVYEHEPEVHTGLLELPNVTLLPHVGSATPRTRGAMVGLAARNVWSVLSGREPITPVRR